MKTQVFVFNYNHFDDASDLFNKFNALGYDTFILNCEGPNDPEFEQTDRIKKYPNIYYSGQWNEMLSLGNADVFFIVNADVKIPKINFLMKRLEKFYSHFGDKAGIYAPNHEWTPWTYNPYLLPTLEFDYKVVPTPDSTIWAVTNDIARKVDYIDTQTNLFGWGIEIVAAFYCVEEGKHVVRDYNIKCFHPRSTAYSRYQADIQWREWLTKKNLGKKFWEHYHSRDKYEFGWSGDYRTNMQHISFL